MIGIGHSRMARMHVARHLREAHQVAGVHLDQLADDLVDVARRRRTRALARITSARRPCDAAAQEQVAQVGVALEGQRVELLGPVERTVATPSASAYRKCRQSRVSGAVARKRYVIGPPAAPRNHGDPEYLDHRLGLPQRGAPDAGHRGIDAAGEFPPYRADLAPWAW
jgi:hypothetical protein